MMLLLTAATATSAALLAPSAINPRYFAFSSYIGPVVNLTFDDPAVIRVARVLGIGSLRYPGGSTTSSWNYSSGRWIDADNMSDLAERVNAFPRGTFTPDRYMAAGAIGSALKTPPIWNLNLATRGNPAVNIKDPPGQVDILERLRVPVEYLELDNEIADNPIGPYLASAKQVVARARAIFPAAKISIIGCFGVSNHTDCLSQLKKEHAAGLFDAVTLHHYGPNNATVAMASTDLARRAATLAPTLGYLEQQEQMVASTVSPTAPIWLDEFNWGGDWAGEMWPGENHGGLRGLFWASYVLGAIDATDTAKAAGRSGYDAVMSYSLFYQNSSAWSKWASCAAVPDIEGRADLVAFDGVAQVFAHFARVALSSGYTEVVPVRNLSRKTCCPGARAGGGGGGGGGAEARCVLAAKFSGSAGNSSGHGGVNGNGNGNGNDVDGGGGGATSAPMGPTLVAINVCPFTVDIDLRLATAGAGTDFATGSGGDSDSAGGGGEAVTITYSGLDKGGFVLADDIGSLDSPPWRNGPLSPTTTSGLPTNLLPISLSFIRPSPSAAVGEL